jgi:hypothetical protein
LQPNQDIDSGLWIQSKGSVPVIASGLEICAAALVRQIDVVLISPQEPDPIFQVIDGIAAKSAQPAEKYTRTQMSKLFWPLERDRIITAWQRGDFSEAGVWLEGHRSQYKTVYELSKYLALSTNWELHRSLREIHAYWINSKYVRKLCEAEVLQSWQEQINQLLPKQSSNKSKFLLIWESWFIIELELSRENYTAAFLQFAQIVERLLFLRSKSEDWIKKGLIIPPAGKEKWKDDYKPTQGELFAAWQQLKTGNPDTFVTWVNILDTIRETRNGVAHRAEPVTLQELEAVWTKPGIRLPNSGNSILFLMQETIQKIKAPEWKFPAKPLLQELYEWGLKRLQAES